jgi:RNA 2',3'-cyclic 3'-phosphodiesterase
LITRPERSEVKASAVYPHDHKPDVSDQRKRTEQNAPQAQMPGRPVPPQAALPGRPVRLFVGIPLAIATTNDVAATVNQLRSQIREHSPNLRWSAPESWHITLQFLGSTTPQQYECVLTHVRELRHRPIHIQLGALGTFDRAGVLFVDVHVTPQLHALQQAVTAATAPCGFVPEDRPYHPHITLARRKGKGEGGELRNLKVQITTPPKLSGFNAESFVLYESILSREGSIYEIRERFPLSA